MKKCMQFDVFGRVLIVERIGDSWKVFYQGVVGKKRTADNIMIPSFVIEENIGEYLEDICHEWATGPDSRVKKVG